MVTRRVLSLLAMLAVAATVAAQTPTMVPSASTRQQALDLVASQPGRAFQFVAARLRTGRDIEGAGRQLDSLLGMPTGDMFWSFPAVAFYYYCRDLVDASTRARFRAALRSYAPYRGDTENHFLMHYTFLYLFAQEWPEMTREEWFNGRNSVENMHEAREYLLHWIDDVARHGMTEWDAPRYHYFYITPLLTLRDFAHDGHLRRRAEMMLELLLADMATDYLDGCYVGAHARDGDAVVLSPRMAEASAYAGFYFEDTVRVAGPDLAFAAMSSWSAPAIVRQIATDRSIPYVSRELKRSRARMRHAPSVFDVVHRYTYMTRDFAVGSIQGGIHQPIQQHSWDVTFATRRAQNTLFSLHPDVSADELATFFPEEPELMEAGIITTKSSYGSDEKWLGGSRYERIGQLRNVLVVRYDLPSTVRFQHADFFLPDSLDARVELPNGWILLRVDRSLVCIKIVTPSSTEWIDSGPGIRLRVTDRRILALVEVLSTDDIRFDQLVSARRDDDCLIRHRSGFIFRGVRGTVVVDTSRGGIRVTEPGAPRDRRPARKLFDGPHVQSIAGSGRITLRSGGRTRTLDFTTGTVTE